MFNRTFDPADKGGDADSAIMRVRPDGSGLTVVSDTPRVETFGSFSPDGRSVVFVEWFPNAAGERNRNGELVVVDIKTGARRNVTNSEAFDAYPYWGASGRWIYFGTAATGGPNGREVAIHRIQPDGKNLERISPLDGFADARPVPTDDEKTLYFNMIEPGHVSIRRMKLPAGPE